MFMRFPVCEPLIPIALWLSLAVAALGLLMIYGVDLKKRVGGLRGGALTALMALAVALPLGILLNPTWLERIPPPAGKPLLTILVDASHSMATPDGGAGSAGQMSAAAETRRWDEARQIVSTVDRQLSEKFEVRLRTFAASGQSVDAPQLKSIEPDGAASDLGTAITQAVAADRPQGQAVLLLSDGIDNVGGEAGVVEAAANAKVVSAPIYVKTLGGPAEVRDLAVDIPTPQDLAFVGQIAPLRVQLTPHGLHGGTSQVILTLDGREVERRDVVFTDDRPQDVEFLIRQDHSGVYRYEAQANVVAGEVTDANNHGTYVLRVVDEPIRVLLLEGKPYWDTKFLLRTLAMDQSLEIVSVTRLAAGRFLERTLKRPLAANDAKLPASTNAAAPAADSSATPDANDASAVATENANVPASQPRSESWRNLPSVADALGNDKPLSGYQIVILGRDAEVYLTDAMLAMLRQWLSRDGGSLVCFRGTPTVQMSQRLGALLPVRTSTSHESRFHLKLTEVGRELRWIPASAGSDPLTRLPSLVTRASSSTTQPLTVVWAVGQSSSGGEAPAVTSMPYGTGRVVVLEGAGMWRWAFLPPQYQAHERVYGALWQSLTRWLVSNTGLLPTQQWALRPDKISFDAGEAATLSLLLRESALPAGPPLIELSGDALSEPRTLTPITSGEDPGVYRVACGHLPVGRYQAKIAGATADDSTARTMFDVHGNVDEVIRIAANPWLMNRIAAESGGAVLGSGAADELLPQLEKHLARTHPDKFLVTTAWDRWWVLLSVFGVWGAVWALRRHSGLV